MCFEEHFKRNFIQPLLHFIYIFHIDQIYKLLLIFISQDIYIYVYIGIFQQAIRFFHTP